ncbi:MAG: MATE family efflux transporter [Eubacteriales bacterium]
MQDMTKGSIARHLIRYAIPMILGNLMQLTYNAADSVIVGKRLGENALAAVSVSGPIMTILILGASGIGIGASVLMSRFYGAGDHNRLKREFSTTVLFGLALSFAVFVIGLLLHKQLLTWIHTPAESFSMAALYLKIMLVGFLFTFQYNILSSAMRGIGDSGTPVCILGISCTCNILLDIWMVMVLNLGIAGAALATVVSQGISVLLCVVWIAVRIPVFRLGRREYVIDRALLWETVQSGSLTALQQAAQPIGKVLIQGVVNLQGVDAIGAFNAVCRVDDYACIPAQSIGNSIMTCTAQNRGAKKQDRVFRTIKVGLLIALCYFPIIWTAVQLLKKPAVMLLTPDDSPVMAEMGCAYLAVKAWFFIMPCILNAVQGFFRGMGRMALVLTATLIQISIRTVCVSFWVPVYGIVGEAYACFAGWMCQLVFLCICLFLTGKKRHDGAVV